MPRPRGPGDIVLAFIRAFGGDLAVASADESYEFWCDIMHTVHPGEDRSRRDYLACVHRLENYVQGLEN